MKSVYRRKKYQRATIRIEDVAADAGVSRGTIYYHYGGLNEAVEAGEEKLLENFSKFLENQLSAPGYRGTSKNWRVFYALFLYIYRCKSVFYEICQRGADQRLLYQMMKQIFPALEIEWLPKGQPAPALGSERVDFYFRRAVGVICHWGLNTKCDFSKANQYIRQIIDLTNEAAKKYGA